MDNFSWQLGSGQNILLWEDAWCGEPLKDRLNINETLLRELPAKVCDIIHNRSWLIPQNLDVLFPILKDLVHEVTIHLEDLHDKLLWNNSSSGDLVIKLKIGLS
jgi:hypothetical protein